MSLLGILARRSSDAILEDKGESLLSWHGVTEKDLYMLFW